MEQSRISGAGDSSARFRKRFGIDRNPMPASFNEFQNARREAEAMNLDPRGLKDRANTVTSWIDTNTITLRLSEREKARLSDHQAAVHRAFKQYDSYTRIQGRDRSAAVQNFREKTQNYLEFVREIGRQHPVELFYLTKGIRPLTREEIQEKNRYYENRYYTLVRTSNDNLIISVYNKNNPGSILDYYYSNSINLQDREIEGSDNLAWRDDQESGPGRMKLSNIKYQALRKGLEYLERTNEPQLERFKNLSIDNFQPNRLRGGHPIRHLDTKETVLELTRAYIGRKQRNSENFTQEEMRGEFFFPPNSDEFKQIMVNTVLGKEKLFFLGNYFPHRRCAGVKCEVNFRDEEVESMTYPLEQWLASGQRAGPSST